MAYEYEIISCVPQVKRGVGWDWSEAERKLNELIAENWEIESSGMSSHGLFMLGGGFVRPSITFVLRNQKV